MLLATLRDASKKQAEDRTLDVEEAAEKGIKCREWTQRSSYLQVDGFVPYYPVELILKVREVPTSSHQLRSAIDSTDKLGGLSKLFCIKQRHFDIMFYVTLVFHVLAKGTQSVVWKRHAS